MIIEIHTIIYIEYLHYYLKKQIVSKIIANANFIMPWERTR